MNKDASLASHSEALYALSLPPCTPNNSQIDYLDGLMAFLTEEEKKKHESLLNTVTQREKDEAIHLRRTCFGCDQHLGD